MFLHAVFIALGVSCSISMAQEKGKGGDEPKSKIIRHIGEALPKGAFSLRFEQNLGAPAETTKSAILINGKNLSFREEKWYIQNGKMVAVKALDESRPHCILHRTSNMDTTQPGIFRMDEYPLTTRIDDSIRIVGPPNSTILHRMITIGGTNDDRIYYYVVVPNQSELVPPREPFVQLMTSARGLGIGITTQRER